MQEDLRHEKLEDRKYRKREHKILQSHCGDATLLNSQLLPDRRHGVIVAHFLVVDRILEIH
jgi:hypothetical protein